MKSDNGKRREPSTARGGAMSGDRGRSRRALLETLLVFGAAGALYAQPDLDAWRAYEAVEEAWIRDRHELLIQHAPAVVSAARIDLDIKLADLQRRAAQFRHLLAADAGLLRGGIWQLSAIPVSDERENEMNRALPEYRKISDHVRHLNDVLRVHPQYDRLRREQVRLWKTPQYREIHRRYMGRMQDLQRLYGSSTASTAVAAGN